MFMISSCIYLGPLGIDKLQQVKAFLVLSAVDIYFRPKENRYCLNTVTLTLLLECGSRDAIIVHTVDILMNECGVVSELLVSSSDNTANCCTVLLNTVQIRQFAVAPHINPRWA